MQRERTHPHLFLEAQQQRLDERHLFGRQLLQLPARLVEVGGGERLCLQVGRGERRVDCLGEVPPAHRRKSNGDTFGLCACHRVLAQQRLHLPLRQSQPPLERRAKAHTEVFCAQLARTVFVEVYKELLDANAEALGDNLQLAHDRGCAERRRGRAHRARHIRVRLRPPRLHERAEGHPGVQLQRLRRVESTLANTLVPPRLPLRKLLVVVHLAGEQNVVDRHVPVGVVPVVE
mmetsp:Transcript_2791/g.6768  ORF Transcript_2791/g.6768 Transcript_2791/m.6768 type:complete len:233 (-) Transcript_2791:1433-2131(-)